MALEKNKDTEGGVVAETSWNSRATNVQFSNEMTREMLEIMPQLGFTKMTDFIKFSCKQMCNIVKERGAIPYNLSGKKKIIGETI